VRGTLNPLKHLPTTFNLNHTHNHNLNLKQPQNAALLELWRKKRERKAGKQSTARRAVREG
jgi:hypothetical protein